MLIAYIMFRLGFFEALPQYFHGHGYISMFLGGLLFTVGFSTPFGVALFVAMADEVDPIYGALIGACGALLMDMLIFEFARLSLHDEIEDLKTIKIIAWVRSRIFKRRLPEKIRLYALWCVAGIVIASPLPDEFGVTLLSGVRSIEAKRFALLCFLFNTVGIFLVLALSRSI